ncbi:hypothetical protein, partial [Duncaniella muris]|uniref:hypothetical protein n=1 Tax=Duncaniella muris TaxID=2094150 RepID=UPI00272B75B4
EGDVRQDIGLLIARDTAAQSAQVSRVCHSLSIWCPVEDTDLPLRMVCLRTIALIRGPGVVSLQKFFPIWILTTVFYIDQK